MQALHKEKSENHPNLQKYFLTLRKIQSIFSLRAFYDFFFEWLNARLMLNRTHNDKRVFEPQPA